MLLPRQAGVAGFDQHRLTLKNLDAARERILFEPLHGLVRIECEMGCEDYIVHLEQRTERMARFGERFYLRKHQAPPRLSDRLEEREPMRPHPQARRAPN